MFVCKDMYFYVKSIIFAIYFSSFYANRQKYRISA